MIAIPQEKAESAQKLFKKEIKLHAEKAHFKLLSLKKRKLKFGSEEIDYLDKTIQLFENSNIITASPSQIRTYASNIGQVPTNTRFHATSGRKLKQLKKFIVDALDYRGLRRTFYPKYFHEIGIKACVYCNSQLTVTILKGKEYKARFDVDHYYPKDGYPFLAISLFNLYPTCASCNRMKSTNMIDFELYSGDRTKTSKSEYEFVLDPAAKARYLTTKDASDITFSFEGPTARPNMQNIEETLHVNTIYQSQVDIAEELIIKSQVYNREYINQLSKRFDKLKLSPEKFERSIIGNYTRPHEIHKRPIAKFTQDIARQLKLIK